MESLRPVSLSSFSYILLHLASLAIAQPSFLYYECANGVGNYTTNSNFQRNLNSFLSSLDSNTQIDYGFYNLSVGQTGPDQANASALSRGDIGVEDCRLEKAKLSPKGLSGVVILSHPDISVID